MANSGLTTSIWGPSTAASIFSIAMQASAMEIPAASGSAFRLPAK